MLSQFNPPGMKLQSFYEIRLSSLLLLFWRALVGGRMIGCIVINMIGNLLLHRNNNNNN